MKYMTIQEMYNTAFIGLRAQGFQQSLDAGDEPGDVPECRYRGLEGRRCAFGFLVTAEDYDPLFEGQVASTVISSLFPKDNPFSDEELRFVDSLQNAHDLAENTAAASFDEGRDPTVEEIASAMERSLRELAVEYDLTVPE